MNEKDEDLITQSEAARLTGTSAQNISSKIKRGRLNFQDSRNKLLSKKEVLNLEKGKSGRPLKSVPIENIKRLKELNDFAGKFSHPEKFYPNSSSIFLRLRKENFDDSLPLLWKSPLWRRNRLKLKKSLRKKHNKIWATYISGDRIYVRRKFKESVIEDFYNFCLFSEKIYQNHFSIAALKLDFLSHCQSLLSMKPDKERIPKKTAEILTLFAEGIELNFSPEKSALRVVNLLLQSKKNLTNVEKREEANRILRKLYDSSEIKSKSIDRIAKQVKTEVRRKPSKI